MGLKNEANVNGFSMNLWSGAESEGYRTLKEQWNRGAVYPKALRHGDGSQPHRHRGRTFAGIRFFLPRVFLKFPSGPISFREFELMYERSHRKSSLAIVGDAEGVFRRLSFSERRLSEGSRMRA